MDPLHNVKVLNPGEEPPKDNPYGWILVDQGRDGVTIVLDALPQGRRTSPVVHDVKWAIKEAQRLITGSGIKTVYLRMYTDA